MNQTKAVFAAILFIVTLFMIGSCASVLAELDRISMGSGETETPAQEQQTPQPTSTAEEPAQPQMEYTELAAAEQEIFRLVNIRRAEQNLPSLVLHAELSQVAREHSADMATRNYYSHIDPQGVTPHQRIESAMGDRYYLETSAENIAYSERSDGFSSARQQQIAQNFMHGWMNSPGHRANILRRGMTHIGIGLHRKDNRIYATQKFISYIARLSGTQEGSTLALNEATIPFVLNAHRLDKEKLTVLLRLPDENAKWPTGDGRYYRGLGYITPQWSAEHQFSVELPISAYGKGTYSIQLGAQGTGAVQQKAFTFHVK